MKALAPIILFVYNRPKHTLRTLEALSANPEAKDSHLFIFADGPKASATDEQRSSIAATRDILHSRKWCASVTVIESFTNQGLAAAVVDGVTSVISSFGKAIVLEDDHETSPFFLAFMNQALQKYEAEEKVACISGYVYPLEEKFTEAFFIRGADCWGWATWANRWNTLVKDAGWLKKEIEAKNLVNIFTFNGSYPYMKMLEDRAQGLNQSWAILWYATALISDRLCLYPPQSLVHNTGNDGSGTHTSENNSYYDIDVRNAQLPRLPVEISEDPAGRKAFEEFFIRAAKGSAPTMLSRIRAKMKNLFSK